MAKRYFRQLSAFLRQTLNLFLPPVCCACQLSLEDSSSSLCPACASQAQLLSTGICERCGSPLEKDHCTACDQIDFDFELSRNAFNYQEPVISMIQNLKYRGFTHSAIYLAAGMAKVVQNIPEYSACDYICAVPLYPVRRRERGYNQSELIAKHLSKYTGIRYLKGLKRRRYTKSQTKLPRSERLNNLYGAFKAVNRCKIEGKSLILVDDVFTTGSTLNESSKALHAAGVARVYGLTAARA
ncbi:MAG: ComF family protein [Candidatus Cloacimonadaceae bacterium]